MKKRSFIFVLSIIGFSTLMMHAQYIPKGFSYQAVAREGNGLEMKNKDISVLVSIIPDEPSNIAEYAEIHNVKTDPFGLFNVIIGQGIYSSGDVTKFSEINWGKGPRFLKVEIDFGSGYQNMGSIQLLAVPYALHSGTAANAMNVSDDQLIQYNPDTRILTLQNGGEANLNSLYQVLSYSKGTLSLSPGNSVSLLDLEEDEDSDPGNEKQGLVIDANHMLMITSDTMVKQVDLSPYLVDNQNLATSGDTLKIDRGSFVLTDNDKTNELQKLSITGSNLTISPGGNTINITPDIIAFRAFKSNGGTGYPAGRIVKLEFADSLNIGNGFNNGTFTVPVNGSGLYFFQLTYKFDGNQNLSIYKNDIEIEKIYDYSTWSYPIAGINSIPFILDLKDNDKIEIISTFINFGSTQPGIFMGYRVH